MPLKTYLPLVELIFPHKESDLTAVDLFFQKHEAQQKKERSIMRKLIEKAQKSKREGKIGEKIQCDEDEYDEDNDEELQSELAAEQAREDEISDTGNLEKIKSIDIRDPDSFMRIAAFANDFKHAFRKLCSEENDRCSDCSLKYYEQLVPYQQVLKERFCLLVGYWSAKYKDLTEHHESRTSRSTDTKRRNKETAKRIVIDEYRKFSRNYTDKSDLLLMSERKILLRMKAAVDPVLKAKGIYRNGISTNTLRQILREAKEKGKISSYPKHDI